MPLSDHYSAPVPLVTGLYADSTLSALSDLFTKAKEHNNWNQNIAGVHLESASNWHLIENNFGHNIHLGEPSNWQEKFYKLDAFYRYGLDTSEAKKIKSLDLAYQNQVICRK